MAEPLNALARCAAMKTWPALALFALVPACTHPIADPVPSGAYYRALGQEPGWNVTIADGRVDYVGDYGETRITVPAPEPIIAINGEIYRTERLQVHISHGRCNDAMSGWGYADTVMVIADGQTLHGCGGERRPDWDM